jgi:hypothetical protein
VAVLVLASQAEAEGLQRVKGRINDPVTECLSRFEGTVPNFPPARPRKIRCVDNDPTCDADPEAGLCGISMQVRLNVTDPGNPECAPGALEDYLVQNWVPDTNPKHEFSFQNLEDVVNFLLLPLDSTDRDVLSLLTLVDVPLRLSPRAGGGKWGRAAKLLKTRASTGPGGRFDVDRMRLICVPDDSSSPCDGVTSTFDQIQKQVFDRSCAVPTCHVAPTEPHRLSLLSGGSYASLVNVAPANVGAQDSGKLRVHAGQSENSFLVDKLLGELGLAEGERMPLGRKRINRRVLVRLIEEWIASGAPETGFVSDLGCPAP